MTVTLVKPSMTQVVAFADGTYSNVNTLPIVNPPSPQLPPSANDELLYPQLDDLSNLSTEDLIALISKNIGRVNALLGNTQATLLRARQNDIEATAKEALEKLNDSIKKMQEAEESRRKMKIVNWFLTALSVVVTIVVSVITAGAGSVAAAVIGAVISGVLLLASSIPVKDGKSMMDHLTEQLGVGLAKLTKAIVDQYMKDNHLKDTSAITASGQTEAEEKNKEVSQYSAMAIIVALQVVIAIVVAVVSRGGSAGNAVSNIAKALTKAGASGVAEALQKNAQAIITASMRLAKTAQIIGAVGKMAGASANIHSATLQKSSTLSDADVQELNAFIKLLQRMLEADQQLLQQLMESASMDASQIKNLMNTTHGNNMRNIHTLTV